jgi:heme/copper-type cytochrome/quinol oxidase subunit 2
MLRVVIFKVIPLLFIGGSAVVLLKITNSISITEWNIMGNMTITVGGIIIIAVAGLLTTKVLSRIV